MSVSSDGGAVLVNRPRLGRGEVLEVHLLVWLFAHGLAVARDAIEVLRDGRCRVLPGLTESKVSRSAISTGTAIAN